MSEIITKELLSEVLGKTVSNPRFATSDIMLRYSYGQGFQEINIYELAHKCKEWALHKYYTVKSYYDHCGFAFVYLSSGVIDMRRYNIPRFKSNTEPEAILKSCQWILENKDKA